MGDHPIPLARHEGWVYAVVLEGAPVLRIRERTVATCRGDVFVFHPECPYGWNDGAGLRSRVMTWLWRTPPAHAALAPEPGGCFRLKAGEAALRRIEGINRDCQRAVASVGGLADLTLRRAHLDMDIVLARELGDAENPGVERRMAMALDFLRKNPALRQPVKSLCEYLQVSPASLRDLFQKHCGRSARDVAIEMRMIHARQLLSTGSVPVKQVAYELGYAHPNDFCRAFKRQFGVVARDGKPLALP